MSDTGTEIRFKVIIDVSCGNEVDPDAVHDAFRDYLEGELSEFDVDIDNPDYDEDDEDSEEMITYRCTVDTIREIDYDVL